MFKWGDTQLQVKVGSYRGPFPTINITETNLIPIGTATPSSSLQTGGRLRKKATMGIILDTFADYQALYDAYLASEVRLLELMDGVTMESAMIFAMDAPDYKDVRIECGIQFIEV